MQRIRQFAISTVIPRVITGRCLSTSTALNMPIKVGDSLPEVELFEGTPADKVKTTDLFANKKTVVFAVPGAFTPTCSNTHVPGFISSATELKAKGVTDIVCISVNDPFVMSAWGKQLGADGKVRMLADTSAAFTKAVEMDMDLTAVLGGVRSKRYAMVVENGVVKAIQAEPDNTGLSCSAAQEVIKLV